MSHWIIKLQKDLLADERGRSDAIAEPWQWRLDADADWDSTWARVHALLLDSIKKNSKQAEFLKVLEHAALKPLGKAFPKLIDRSVMEMYAEVQIHGGIDFGRDVAQLIVNERDAKFKKGVTLATSYRTFSETFSVDTFRLTPTGMIAL